MNSSKNGFMNEKTETKINRVREKSIPKNNEGKNRKHYEIVNPNLFASG